MRDGRDEVEYLMLSATKPVEADQSPLVTPISSIFVYTDFIEYVIVGDHANAVAWLPASSEHLGKPGVLELQPCILRPCKRAKH